MARPKDSRKEKELRGTLRKDREAGESVTAEKITDIHRCYDVSGYSLLPMRAKAIYRQKCKELMAGSGLYKTDLQQIVIYARTYDIYWEADAKVKKLGILLAHYDKLGNLIYNTNPAYYVCNNAAKLISSISARFGFSPIDRQKLKVESSDESDPLAEFMETFD